MKIEIIQTIHNTIRVTIKFNKSHSDVVTNSKEYQLFELLSICGGFDKKEQELISWELPLSLSTYLKEKFSHYQDCEIQLL